MDYEKNLDCIQEVASIVDDRNISEEKKIYYIELF